jgi:hypothetical protein
MVRQNAGESNLAPGLRSYQRCDLSRAGEAEVSYAEESNFDLGMHLHQSQV